MAGKEDSPVSIDNPERNVPINLKEIKGGRYISGYLGTRKLWQERPQRPLSGNNECLFINLQNGSDFVFNGRDFRGLEQFTPEAVPRSGLNAIVVITGDLRADSQENGSKPGEIESGADLYDSLAGLTPFLKEGGSFFVFEKVGDDKDREWREQVLDDLGLVNRNVLTSGRAVRNALLWEATFPKNHKGLKHPINLIDEGPFWRRDWIQKELQRMRDDYANRGYSIVDESALIKALSSTKFVPLAIQRLKDGFGVTVKDGHCPTDTCVTEWMISGKPIVISSCGEKHYHGVDAIPDISSTNKKASDFSGVEKEQGEEDRPICFDPHPDGKVHYMIRREDGIAECPQHPR